MSQSKKNKGKAIPAGDTPDALAVILALIQAEAAERKLMMQALVDGNKKIIEAIVGRSNSLGLKTDSNAGTTSQQVSSATPEPKDTKQEVNDTQNECMNVPNFTANTELTEPVVQSSVNLYAIANQSEYKRCRVNIGGNYVYTTANINTDVMNGNFISLEFYNKHEEELTCVTQVVDFNSMSTDGTNLNVTKKVSLPIMFRVKKNKYRCQLEFMVISSIHNIIIGDSTLKNELSTFYSHHCKVAELTEKIDEAIVNPISNKLFPCIIKHKEEHYQSKERIWNELCKDNYNGPHNHDYADVETKCSVVKDQNIRKRNKKKVIFNNMHYYHLDVWYDTGDGHINITDIVVKKGRLQCELRYNTKKYNNNSYEESFTSPRSSECNSKILLSYSELCSIAQIGLFRQYSTCEIMIQIQMMMETVMKLAAAILEMNMMQMIFVMNVM